MKNHMEQCCRILSKGLALNCIFGLELIAQVKMECDSVRFIKKIHLHIFSGFHDGTVCQREKLIVRSYSWCAENKNIQTLPL